MRSAPYDAIAVGETATFGTYEFTAERIKAFARQWDPQVFHVDEEAAKHTAFGGLCASGWHTCAVLMRLQVDHFAARARDGAPFRFGPSPGFEDLKWIRPVYAGDRITFTGQVTDKRLSQSMPGMAIVTTAIAGINQDEKPVMSMTAHVFVLVG
jgi:acyl dehydratase